MRNILGSFLRLYARPEASTRLLFATPAGERHEIGTLGAAMLAASSGLGVAYLGPDLPAREIVDSVRPAGAQVLVLGLTDDLGGEGARSANFARSSAISRRRSSCGRADAAPCVTPRSSAREDWSFATTTPTNRSSSASADAWRDARDTSATCRRCASRVSAALAAVVLTLVATSAAAQDTTGVGAISGVVVNAAGQPAEGVRVCALDTASCATSDARGVFRIGELRAGAYRLEILPLEGLPFTSDPVDVRAGLDGTVEITLPTAEDFQQTVTVTAPAFQAPEAVKNSGFLVEPREILKSAAALQDVSRYVQGLPGVVIGTNDFRNDIIVRGGSPLENLFVVDNVEIPNINAFANFASAGGTVSLLDAELLQDVTFLTGGYPAPYINRTSSVLQVTQREGNRKKFGGWATLGFAGAGAILEGPINAGKGSWVVSARRSFLDLFTEDVGFGGVPVVYSFNAKAVYDLTPRDRIWLVNIAGIDEIRLGLTESTDLEEEIANFDIRYDGWRSATGFNWQRTFGSRGVGLLGITPLRGQGGPAGERPGGAGRAAAGCAARGRHRAEPGRLLRGLARGRDHHQVRPHACTCRSSTRCRPAAASRRSASTTRWNRPTATTRRTRRWPASTRSFSTRGSGSYQTGAYLQASKQVASRVNVTLGGRVDHYAILSQARFSPRAGVNVRLTDTLSWNSSAGSYYQQPAFLFVSAFPQNASLVPWRADHYVTGLAWSPDAVPAGDGRGVSEDLHRLPGGERPAHRVAGQHRRHLRRARDPVSAHERRRRVLARAWSSSSRSGSPRSSTARATCRFRARGMRASTACSGPARSTTRSCSTCSAAIGCRRRGNSRPGSRFCRAGRSRPTTRRCPRHSGAACTTSRASTPSERLITAASTSAWTAPSPWAGSRSTCSSACRT